MSPILYYWISICIGIHLVEIYTDLNIIAEMLIQSMQKFKLSAIDNIDDNN